MGVVVRTNGALPCVYAWAKTDADRDNDSVRVTATAVLTNDGTEVDRFEDTFTVEQRDTKSGVGEAAPLDLTAPPPRTFTAGRAINVPALPAASGGSGSYSYALTGRGGAARPSWLGFDPAMRRMTGTPPASAAGTTATLDYTVADGRTSQTQSFTVTVNAAPSLTAPSNRTYTAGTAISAFTLQAASGGTTPLVYEVEDLPAGLEFKPATRELSGTPSTATTDPVAVTYKVTDANGVEATDTFSVTVFPALELDAPADLSLKQGQALADTTLPAATGGDGSYSYAIFPAPPEGLEFDSGTRVLSGTPESAQATTEYRYVVGDGIGNFTETTFGNHRRRDRRTDGALGGTPQRHRRPSRGDPHRHAALPSDVQQGRGKRDRGRLQCQRHQRRRRAPRRPRHRRQGAVHRHRGRRHPGEP